MVVKQENKNYMYAIGIVSGAVLISLLTSFTVIKKEIKDTKRLSADIKVKDDKLKTLEKKLETLQGLKDKEETLTKEKDKVLSALPDDKDVSRLFVQLDKMIADTGASVASATETTDGSSATTTTATNISVAGVTNHGYEVAFKTPSYASIKNALDNMEKALRLVNLDSFKIDSSSSQDGFSVTFGLKTYSRGEASK